MPRSDIKWRNEWMRRHRAAKLYALPDIEKHPLRVWRKAQGLSMAAAGRVLDVSGTAVRTWEVGIAPTPDWVLECIGPEMADYLAPKIALENTAKIYWNDHPLRQWRKARELSQEELGFVLGRTKGTIEKWETGAKATPDWVMKKLEEYDEYLRKEKDLRDRRMDQLFADAGPRGGL